MKISPLEIALIIVVVIAVALIARISRLSRPASPVGKGPGSGVRLKGLFKNTGIILIIAGIAILGVAAGLFRWALQGYLWALVFIAGGTVMVLLARRKV